MAGKLLPRAVLGWICLIGCLIGCGAEPVGPEAAGIEAGIASRVEAIALDEVTRLPLMGAQVTFIGADGVLGVASTDADGRAVVTTDTALVAVEISAPDHVTERWMVAGRRVVVPLQAETVRQAVERTLTGVVEGEQWTVIATSPARVLHANPLEVSPHAICEAHGDGTCTARLEGVAMDGTTSLLAFRTGAEGPDEVRVLGTVDQDLAAADRFEVTRIDVSIPDPGEGSTAVVGVPGLGVSGRVAVLPWPMSEGSMIVPDTATALGSAWVVFTSEAPDGSTSVLLARGTMDAPHWTEWLGEGTLSGLRFDAAPGTDLVAVAWYGEQLLRHDLFASDGPVLLDPPSGAVRAVVRAIDTRDVAVELDLDAAERETERFTDQPLAL